MITKNIYQRVHEAMGEVTYVQKEKKAGMMYSTVSHDDVTAKVRPVLHKAGIVYHPTALTVIQDGNRTQVELTVRFVNIDDKTDFIDVPSLGYGIDSQDKGPGKAISYAVKYALLKLLGLETGDDPDNDQTTTHKPAPKVEKPGEPTKTISDGEHTINIIKTKKVGDKEIVQTEIGRALNISGQDLAEGATYDAVIKAGGIVSIKDDFSDVPDMIEEQNE